MCEKLTEDVNFTPPLYIQRYLKTTMVIEDVGKGQFSKIVDIGCSELRLFHYLRRIEGVNEIILLDINHQLLKDARSHVNPLIIDNIHRRNEPLSVTVVCADAKYPHSITLNADVVTMIEFIEHLYEVELIPVVRNVFGIIMPKLVIISTPNYDFNRFFRDLPQGSYRHPDHKFEWTKKIFEEWCAKVVCEFPQYVVRYSGCGQHGNSKEFCSQFGIFQRKDTTHVLKEEQASCEGGFNDCKRKADAIPLRTGKEPCQGCLDSGTCVIIHSSEYPFDDRTTYQKFLSELRASLHNLRLRLKEVKMSRDSDENDSEIVQYHSNPPWEELLVNEPEISSPSGSHPETDEVSSASGVSSSRLAPSSDLIEEFHNKEEIDLNVSLEELEVEDNWEDFFSSDSEDEALFSPIAREVKLPQKPSSNMCASNALCFKLRSVPSVQTLHEELQNEMSNANIFFYVEENTTFYVPVGAFCIWNNFNISETEIREALSTQLDWSLEEINSNLLILLCGEEEEESSDDDDDDDEENLPTLLDRERG